MIYNIYCPGLSLSNIHNRDMIGAHKHIAVNGAILQQPVVHCWAMQDYEVYATCIKKYPCDLMLGAMYQQLIIPNSWYTHHDTWARQHRCDRSIYEYTAWTYSKNQLDYIMPTLKHPEAGTWSEYTTFTAIAYAMKHGATEIRLFGADMEGEGYCNPDLENERTNHSQKRWNREKLTLELIIEAAQKRGVTIERRGV